MVTIVNKQPGLAGIQTDTFITVEILAGDTPAQVSDSGKLSSAQATSGIPIWTPVNLNQETGEIKLAVYDATTPANAVVPNAITSINIPAGAFVTGSAVPDIDIPAGAFVTGSAVPVWTAGSYNVEAINWPASYTDHDKKMGAFAKATGCQIYIRAPYYK